MSITRRQFLLGSATGFVLPSVFEKAYAYIENHGEPLLIPPRKPSETLYACGEFVVDGFRLNLGDPERWWHEFWLGGEDTGPIDWHARMSSRSVEEWWDIKYSPWARAYHYLGDIDLEAAYSGDSDLPFRMIPITCSA